MDIVEASPLTPQEEVQASDFSNTDPAEQLTAVVEALIFAAPKAITPNRIKKLLADSQFPLEQLNETLDRLMDKHRQSGLVLCRVGQAYQFRTHPVAAPWVKQLLEDRPARLSPAALEVLSIIAYKQPITRADVDHVRGVDSGHLFKSLLEKNLIKAVGQAELPGRPLLFETTPYFLEVFTLNSLEELPSLEAMDRDLKEPPAEMDQGTTEETLFSDDSALESELAFLEAKAAQMDFSPLNPQPERGAFDQPVDHESLENGVADFGLDQRANEELSKLS